MPDGYWCQDCELSFSDPGTCPYCHNDLSEVAIEEAPDDEKPIKYAPEELPGAEVGVNENEDEDTGTGIERIPLKKAA